MTRKTSTITRIAKVLEQLDKGLITQEEALERIVLDILA
jgi:hypothetical protein